MPSRTSSGPHRQSPTPGSGRRTEWPTRLPGTGGPVDCLRIAGLTLQHLPGSSTLGSHLGAALLPIPPPHHPRPTGTTRLTCANAIQAGKIINRASFGTQRSWVQIPPPRQPKHQVRRLPHSVGASPVCACVSNCVTKASACLRASFLRADDAAYDDSAGLDHGPDLLLVVLLDLGCPAASSRSRTARRGRPGGEDRHVVARTSPKVLGGCCLVGERPSRPRSGQRLIQ
jgi:hypothetical protein